MKKKRDKAEEFKKAFKDPANIVYTPEDMGFGSMPFEHAKEVLILIPISINIPPQKIEGSEVPPYIRSAFRQIKNLEVCNHKTEHDLWIEFLSLLIDGHLFVTPLGQMVRPNTEAAKTAIRKLYVKETD